MAGVDVNWRGWLGSGGGGTCHVHFNNSGSIRHGPKGFPFSCLVVGVAQVSRGFIIG